MPRQTVEPHLLVRAFIFRLSYASSCGNLGIMVDVMCGSFQLVSQSRRVNDSIGLGVWWRLERLTRLDTSKVFIWVRL